MTLDPQGTLGARGQLQEHLRPGEDLLRSGRPDPAVMFAWTDLGFEVKRFRKARTSYGVTSDRAII